MKLSEIEPGKEAKIVFVGGKKEMRTRLESIGFTAGESVRVERFAPLNGALLVRLGGTGVVMRREIADGVEVELV